MLEECLIEFESLRGGKVRMQWKAAALPDWMSLLRAWAEGSPILSFSVSRPFTIIGPLAGISWH